MVAGSSEPDAEGRGGAQGQRVEPAVASASRTEYPARDLSILDLLPPGVSKGWALERLAARLGVDRKETMAIGDNWNDVDMLEWAGQGVMMGNAASELRDHGQDARLEAGSAQRPGRRGRGAGSRSGSRQASAAKALNAKLGLGSAIGNARKSLHHGGSHWQPSLRRRGPASA